MPHSESQNIRLCQADADYDGAHSFHNSVIPYSRKLPSNEILNIQCKWSLIHVKRVFSCVLDGIWMNTFVTFHTHVIVRSGGAEYKQRLL